MKLEYIALIASVISGLTAITTSLRAIGKSREIARDEAESRIKDCCRAGRCGYGKTSGQGSLRIYIISTVIWLVLSAGSAAPLYYKRWEKGADIWLLIWSLPLIFLFVLVSYIWSKALRHK